MVSDKTPRHSKPKAEPVTIDLDVKDVIATTTTGNPDQESKPTSTNQQNKQVDTEHKNNLGAANWDKEPKIDIEPVMTKSDKSPETTKTSNSDPNIKSDKTSADHSKAYEAAEKTNNNVQAKSSNTSGFIAAGIFGGLVALLLAGSMQYAGYLPPYGKLSEQPNLDLTGLELEISALKKQFANAPTTASIDTSDLENRLTALEKQPVGNGNSQNLASINDAIASHASDISTLKSSLENHITNTGNLASRLTAAEAKINEPRDDIQVASAIASAALKAAIDRGGPFLTELDTLQKVAPNDTELAALEPFASTGVPSRSELLQKFPAVASSMISLLNQPDPNLGIIDRLTHSAFSLVKIRPVGNVEGEGAEAVIARIENKLQNGDLKGASLEWQKLPDEVKAEAASYKSSLDARIQVETLVGDALNRALTDNGSKG